ncbi:MAG: hypothetical protein QM594_09665 [Niabella sp.]
MKIIFQSIIILCTALTLFITGCKKNEDKRPVPTVSDTEPANFLNPYDSFGYWHNVILDSIEQHRTVGRSVNFDRSCGLIRRFYRMKDWPELKESHFAQIPQVVTDAATDIYGFIDRSPWSDSVKARLLQLTNIILQPEADTLTYPQLKEVVGCFENGVLQSSLAVKDKEVLLKSSAIARYSAYRWKQRPELHGIYDHNMLLKFNQENGFATAPIAALKSKQDGFFTRVGKWIAVTAIDISGAITDLSVASGAAASDFMKEVFKAH